MHNISECRTLGEVKYGRGEVDGRKNSQARIGNGFNFPDIFACSRLFMPDESNARHFLHLFNSG
jgi:hypothetical protein